VKTGTIRPSVEDPHSLLSVLHMDCALAYPTPFLAKDFAYLKQRYDKEGLAFLCKTLPALGKAIESSLSSGNYLSVPMGWSLKKGSRLPNLFNVYFMSIFEQDGGIKQPTEASRYAVLLLRQVCLYWSRYPSLTTEDDPTHVSNFMCRITRSREDILTSLNRIDSPTRSVFKLARQLLQVVFDPRYGCVHELLRFRKEPWGKHGPGAVAGRETAEQKWNFIDWPHLPLKLFQWANEVNNWPKPDGVPSARVTCVPKDFRGPRIICIEPKEFQFGQQGLMKTLYGLMHEHPVTKRHINFFDVSDSRRLCFDTRFATIDLKDASDNLSLLLVKWLLPKNVYRLLVRYRTPMVNGQVSTCFATMGSALCFPIQTLIFWALAQSTIKYWRKSRPPQAVTYLRVFGDDIIVPAWCAAAVCNVLTASGLVINPSKTCISSHVRESCGEWVYGGFSSIVLRPKTFTVSSGASWVAFVDQAKQAHEKGLFNLSALLLAQALKAYTPAVRQGRNLQRDEMYVPVLTPRRNTHLNEHAGLYAWHVGGNVSPYSRGDLRVRWSWVSKDSFLFPN
jgi:hypothetical protein